MSVGIFSFLYILVIPSFGPGAPKNGPKWPQNQFDSSDRSKWLVDYGWWLDIDLGYPIQSFEPNLRFGSNPALAQRCQNGSLRGILDNSGNARIWIYFVLMAFLIFAVLSKPWSFWPTFSRGGGEGSPYSLKVSNIHWAWYEFDLLILGEDNICSAIWGGLNGHRPLRERVTRN